MVTIIYLTFTIVLDAAQSLKVFEALQYIATHKVPSLRPSILARSDGQGFIIIVHDYNGPVTTNIVANNLAKPLGYTANFINARIAIQTIDSMALARKWVHNHSALFADAQLWRYPVVTVVFTEPTKPADWPEGEPWPRVSTPLQWPIIEE